MIDKQISEAIRRSQSIGITSHIRPDGDAIGSALALGLALMNAGKTVEMALHNRSTKTFHHLPGISLVKKAFTHDNELYIVVDCSDLERVGGMLQEHAADIVIDHHITNTLFGKLNLVEAESVATCAVLAEHMPAWGLTIDEEIASALLSGILSDSIGFRTSNTSSASLRIAADLVDKGAEISTLYNKALLSRPYESIKYWGYGLARLQQAGGLVWTTLSLEDRKNSGYHNDDDADLTNILSTINQYDIAMLIVEQHHSKAKVSWRARPGINVANLAVSLGGGGHPAAAGAEFSGDLAAVQELVFTKTRDYLKALPEENPISSSLLDTEQ
ncbi:MAG: DHH family phosphoesterase [Anaerolineaceae bacterium]|nr:DHH family phosphoesterase [Anaerolineaceae bacterium]